MADGNIKATRSGDSKRADAVLARRGGGIELLRVPASIFAAVSKARGWAYDRRLLPAYRVDAPVVCVGNLTAGGTGKTPMVLWLARWFEARGLRAGLVSRGYRAAKLEARDGEAAGDEVRFLQQRLDGAPIVQNKNRVAGARRAIELGADVVLLDDGFQHRRLQRDLDLVLVDVTRPWGLPSDGAGDFVKAHLPRGLLRESPSALRRAGAIVLTRTEQVEPTALEALRERLQRVAPGVPMVLTEHRPSHLFDFSGGRHGLERLAGREVDLVSGIGNPQAFERTVEALGARVRKHLAFADHHVFEAKELAELGRGDVAVVTTAKDAVKLEALLPAALGLEVELFVRSGQAVLDALLESLPRARAKALRDSLHEGLHG